MEFTIPSFLIPSGSQHCNICGINTKLWFTRGHDNDATIKYDIIGGGKRKVNCPNCCSSDRDRLLKLFFEEIPPSGNILHVAPEKALSRILKNQPNIHLSQIDKKVGWYKFIYGKNVKNGDLTKLPFKNEQFDWVIANHVLEHIENENLALQEIYRVLKPEGKAIIQIPFSAKIHSTIEAKPEWNASEKETFLGQKDHVRLYGLDFPLRLNLFKVNILQPTDLNIVRKLNLNDQEPVILLTKSAFLERMQHFNTKSFEKIVKT